MKPRNEVDKKQSASGIHPFDVSRDPQLEFPLCCNQARIEQVDWGIPIPDEPRVRTLEASRRRRVLQ